MRVSTRRMEEMEHLLLDKRDDETWNHSRCRVCQKGSEVKSRQKWTDYEWRRNLFTVGSVILAVTWAIAGVALFIGIWGANKGAALAFYEALFVAVWFVVAAFLGAFMKSLMWDEWVAKGKGKPKPHRVTPQEAAIVERQRSTIDMQHDQIKQLKTELQDARTKGNEYRSVNSALKDQLMRVQRDLQDMRMRQGGGA